MLLATLLGLYFIGASVAMVLFYDRDDLSAIFWAFLWPILLVVVVLSLITGAISLVCRRSDDHFPSDPPEDPDDG